MPTDFERYNLEPKERPWMPLCCVLCTAASLILLGVVAYKVYNDMRIGEQYNDIDQRTHLLTVMVSDEIRERKEIERRIIALEELTTRSPHAASE